MSKFKVGDKVIAISKQAHKDDPESYPKVGTIGYVQEAEGGSKLYKVQWQFGSTSCNDLWYAREDEIELFNRDMANEEIWKMLESKMRKNGLKPCGSRLLFTGNISNVYAWEDVHNAIALAYKVGYLRAMKGRPFKFGEKKKRGGHWEPVDPENLPKEGTRVRYSRQICFEDEFYLIGWNVGDEGIVNYHGNYFGVKHEGKNWDGVGIFGYYFDMWVEDDE